MIRAGSTVRRRLAFVVMFTAVLIVWGVEREGQMLALRECSALASGPTQIPPNGGRRVATAYGRAERSPWPNPGSSPTTGTARTRHIRTSS